MLCLTRQDYLLTNNSFSYHTTPAVLQSSIRMQGTYLPSAAMIKNIPQLLQFYHNLWLLLLSGPWQSSLLCKLENFESYGRQGKRRRMKLLGANWNWHCAPTSCSLLWMRKFIFTSVHEKPWASFGWPGCLCVVPVGVLKRTVRSWVYFC